MYSCGYLVGNVTSIEVIYVLLRNVLLFQIFSRWIDITNLANALLHSYVVFLWLLCQ